MSLRLKRAVKSLLFRVRRDHSTGHLYYRVEGKRVYIRGPEECERPDHRRYAFEEIYFKHYLPKAGDVVVDFGAALGTEIVRLAAVAPEVRYIAVEIQPWVYECLCLTLAQLPPGFSPYGLAVGEADVVRIAPTRAGFDASILKGGAVPVECVTWEEFIHRHGIRTVDLLKMNIEGAEAALLEHINLDQVKRVIVSAHDHKADQGQGEHFRTGAAVNARLSAAGFRVTRLQGPWAWVRDWMYAER